MTNTAEKLTLPLFMVKYNGDPPDLDRPQPLRDLLEE